MKMLIITLSMILCTFGSLLAQDDPETKNKRVRDRSVYAELLGPSTLIGVSYDARFKGNKHFGYRIGLGYDYGNAEITGFFNSKSHAFTVPAEVNCLVGKGSSRLELGLGMNLGYYCSHWHVLDEKGSDATFGYFGYGNIGYRLTTKGGFLFRIGITPTLNFGGEHGVEHDPDIYPYLSFGYAF